MSVLKSITDSQYRFVLAFLDNPSLRLPNGQVPASVVSVAVRTGIGIRMIVTQNGERQTAYRLSRRGKQVQQRLLDGRQIVLQPRVTARARYGFVNRSA